jgi:predicted nucleic acid-binding protein
LIVVDTSVWIDFFRDAPTWQVEVLSELIGEDAGVAITDVVLTEVLQGVADDRAARRVERSLGAFDVLRLADLDDFRRAARLYREARRKGLTIRRTLDCLIASVCVREDLPLLHADDDFDRLAASSKLRIVTPGS